MPELYTLIRVLFVVMLLQRLNDLIYYGACSVALP
jgi:hypothetical protein